MSQTRNASGDSSQIRFEVFLWAVVPAVLLGIWVYMFPSEIRGGYWSVFNSWGSLVVPLGFFGVALYLRLRSERRLQLPVTGLIMVSSIVWWVMFAAALKWTLFRLLWLPRHHPLGGG